MKKYYDTREASEYFQALGVQITQGTLTTWRSQGKGPSYKKIAARVYYEKEQLEKFIQE